MKNIRTKIVDAVGPRAVHAVEDGLTAGVVIGTALTEPVVAGVLLALFGAAPKRCGPLAIIKEVTDLVRQDDARAQESYFILSAVAGTLAGVGFGSVLDPLVTAGQLGGLF